MKPFLRYLSRAFGLFAAIIGLLLLTGAVSAADWTDKIPTLQTGGCNVSLDTSSACNLASQNAIDWSRKPEIIDGYLYMSGTTKDGAVLHDATISKNGLKWPTFVFNDRKVINEETSRVIAVGRIWPESVALRLSGTGNPNAIAEVYDVTDTSFDVKVEVPPSLLSDDIRLAITVWSEDVGEEDDQALGSLCVVEN